MIVHEFNIGPDIAALVLFKPCSPLANTTRLSGRIVEASYNGFQVPWIKQPSILEISFHGFLLIIITDPSVRNFVTPEHSGLFRLNQEPRLFVGLFVDDAGARVDSIGIREGCPVGLQVLMEAGT